MTEQFVRVFLSDNSTFDAKLNSTWEVFVFQFITTGMIITSTVLATQPYVVKMVLLVAPVGFDAPNVLAFPEPKGTA